MMDNDNTDQEITNVPRFLFDITISNPNAFESAKRVPTTITLPVSAEEFADALQTIGIHKHHMKDCRFDDVDCGAAVLQKHLPDRIDFDTFMELNYLAAKLQEMEKQCKYDDYNIYLFSAVMETTEKFDSLGDLINTVENLDCYDLLPFCDYEGYGEYLAEDGLAAFSAFSRLDESEDPADHDFVEYILDLHRFLDKERWAHYVVDQKEKGQFTEYGYLMKCKNTFEKVYQNSNDIPDAYKIMPADSQPFHRVESVELASFLIQLHALSGNSLPDISGPIDTLLKDKSSHHLLLVTGSDLYISKFRSAYHRGSEAYDVCKNWSELPDVKAFALHTTGSGPENIMGDIFELDCACLVESIENNSVSPSYIRAALTDGLTKDYPYDQWQSMSGTERGRFHSWQSGFDREAKEALLLNFARSYAQLTAGQEISTASDLLFKMNHSFMSQAENPHMNMLRVSHQSAMALLVRGNTPVFRMVKGGLKELSAMDAVKHQSGAWCKHYEFAVRPDSMSEIKQWADSKSVNVIRKLSRQQEAQDKQKLFRQRNSNKNH